MAPKIRYKFITVKNDNNQLINGENRAMQHQHKRGDQSLKSPYFKILQIRKKNIGMKRWNKNWGLIWYWSKGRDGKIESKGEWERKSRLKKRFIGLCVSRELFLFFFMRLQSLSFDSIGNVSYFHSYGMHACMHKVWDLFKLHSLRD